MKVCNRCKVSKGLDQFKVVKGRIRFACIPCDREYKREGNKKCPGYKRILLKDKTSRANPADRAKWLYKDCKREDKIRGFENNLDIPLIKLLVSLPCHYCGEEKLQKSLDRIDNNKGHTKINVINCCFRCNLIRGSMPFDAWWRIVPAIKSARMDGLFDSWNHKRIK
jgi:hypothetical protein